MARDRLATLLSLLIFLMVVEAGHADEVTSRGEVLGRFVAVTVDTKKIDKPIVGGTRA
jgi:hypothetical protein